MKQSGAEVHPRVTRLETSGIIRWELTEFSKSYLLSHKLSPGQRNQAHSTTLAFWDTGQAFPVCFNFVACGM